MRVPVPPLSCADVGISEFASGEVPGVGGRIKCYPEDFQVNEVRLRDGSICRATFDMVACDAQGHLILGTEHWPTGRRNRRGVLRDPLKGRRPKSDETSFRFVLVKRQADTLEALMELSQALRVPQRTFSFAGIKDSWAVTAQEVCAHLEEVSPMDIAMAVDEYLPWMRVEQFHMIPSSEGMMGWLAPGRLLGNRFAIVIRGAGCPSVGGGRGAGAHEAIQRAVQSVEEFGFINYVGLQRFSKGGVRSDVVGLAYLRGDYPACIEALLSGLSSTTNHQPQPPNAHPQTPDPKRPTPNPKPQP